MTTLQVRNNLKKYIDVADEDAIKRINSFIQIDKEQNVEFDDLTVEQERMLNEAIEEADKGLGIPHDEVMKKYAKWLKK
jgi:predicted transcriptional regulator